MFGFWFNAHSLLGSIRFLADPPIDTFEVVVSLRLAPVPPAIQPALGSCEVLDFARLLGGLDFTPEEKRIPKVTNHGGQLLTPLPQSARNFLHFLLMEGGLRAPEASSQFFQEPNPSG